MPRRRWIGWVAGTVATALVVTLAVIANGFDSRETPREDASVWVERAVGQYARVNTETAEIDTVRVAESPSGVVQTGDLGLLLTQGFGRAWAIDAASPIDVHDDGAADEAGAEADADEAQNADAAPEQPETEESASADAGEQEGGAAMRTPDGTRQVTAAGDFVLFFTQGGEAYLSSVRSAASGAKASLAPPQRLDPLAGEQDEQEQAADGEDGESQQYLADAAAIDERGTVALFSKAEQAIRWYDAATGKWRGTVAEVPAEVPAEGVQLAIQHDRWALLDADGGRLWQQGLDEATELDLSGAARLQASSRSESPVLVADEGGLWSIDGGEAQRTVQAAGAAAQPRYVEGEPVAAWVGATGAQMWTAEGGETPLEIDETVEDLNNPEPEIRSNGSRALVVERRSGMMWTVPDGRLIPVEQWSLIDPPKQESGTVITQDVTEQEPPVAVGDAFGVRAGEPALLPVLLNDYDPNRKDVLTVVPEGLGEGLGRDFGTVTPMSDGQGVLLQPSPTAAGVATFSYRITDGVNVSPPATVTLTVADEATNTAPQWCPVEGCQRAWPSPELAPGGTLILPILEGWVDPEGDPMMLAGADIVNPEDPLRALVTADGRLAVRHTDPNAPAGDSVVRVRLIDSRGAESERDLRLRVRSGAAIEFTAAATTAKVGEATVLRPLDRVTGGSGSFQLVDAVVQQGTVTVTANQGTGTIELLAGSAGGSLVSVTVRDTVTEQETAGIIRVTAVDSRAAFGVPPLRAFVRPLADSTVDVLSAIPGANSRALTVQSATVRDGQLRADVIEHSRVRVSGSTADGQPGRIGSVDIVIVEGDASAQGRLTVFQVADTGVGAIAVTDTATVRAGSVVDIPVLENDVAPPGERLVLHPEVGAPGIKGELAFASGGSVRYLAPKQPGNYTLTYTTYGASSPEQSDVGQVRVTVLPAGANRDPLPATITMRVAPGERVKTAVPLSGVDPDGDRLRLVSVDAPDDAQLSTSILPRSNSIQVEASTSAQRSTQIVDYTVRDSFGGEAAGRLRIIVTEPDPGGGAPVVYSDYVRIAHGASDAAVVRPLDNDLDPTGGTLRLVSVVPNVPDGEGSELYRQLESRLDLSDMKRGVVRISGGDELGTVSFKYTVSSSKSKSTADGLIVVQVSERIGQQAPAVSDTVLSVRDRADFESVGVDVVTDRVRWASGDVSALKLSLWGGAAKDYEVKGSNIIGRYQADGDLVPFRLAGIDMTGAEVETFGFLIVPPLDELRLTLKPGLAPVSVKENKSVDVRVAELLDLGRGDRVELDDGAFGVQRAQASCSAISGTSIRYTAGREAPWSDSCTIRVRLTEQSTYTLLPVPISVVPDQPVVQLNPLTRTVAPGQTESIDLADMVQWQGGREGRVDQLRWQVSGGGGSFEVSSSGGQVQATARANAVPGTQETLAVTVSGSGDSQSVLTLRVGEAAVDAPRGGTVSLQCRVGSSCSASLIGVPGQYDPFAGKSGGGLQLVSVDGGSCSYGNLSAAGDSVQVGWPDAGGPGGRCTASFTVRDAQNRTGTGTIEFDAQGVPRAPTAVTPVGADASSIKVSVTLSGEASHPEVTGVKLVTGGGGAVGSCELGGGQATCTVGGLTPGDRRTYYAVAVNPVGDSAQSANGAETWAYKPPAPPSISAETLTWSDNTDSAKGRVRIDIGPSSAVSRVLTVNGVETPIAPDRRYVVDAGNVDLSVYSLDAPHMIPPAYIGGDGGKGDANSATALAIGAPIAGSAELTLSGANRTDWSISTAGWDANGSPDPLEFRYSIHYYNGSNSSGSGLPQHREFTGTVTASTSYGRAGPVTTNAATTGNQLPTLTGTYGVSGSASNPAPWSIVYSAGTPTYTPAPTGTVNFSGVGPGSPNGTVTQCAGSGVNCSAPGPVTPEGLEPLLLELTQCVAWDGTTVPDHTAIAPLVSVTGQPGGAYTFIATPDGNIAVDWAGLRGQGVFIGGLCPPTP